MRTHSSYFESNYLGLVARIPGLGARSGTPKPPQETDGRKWLSTLALWFSRTPDNPLHGWLPQPPFSVFSICVCYLACCILVCLFFFLCCPFHVYFLYPCGFFVLVTQLTSLRGYHDRCLLSLLETTHQSFVLIGWSKVA